MKVIVRPHCHKAPSHFHADGLSERSASYMAAYHAATNWCPDTIFKVLGK